MGKAKKVASAEIPVKPVAKPVVKRPRVREPKPVAKIAIPIAIPENTLGSIRIGTKFRYNNNVYQKLNEVGAGVVITDLVSDGEAATITLPRDTGIDLFPARATDSDSMD